MLQYIMYYTVSTIRVDQAEGLIFPKAVSLKARVIRISGLESTWRFMGSYKRGCKSPTMGYNYSHPTYTPTYY